MTPGIAAARPPHVEFKQVAVEDRAATDKEGRRVVRNVNHAFIMQVGSKDQVERLAEDWLAQKRKESYSGTFPEEWYEFFKKKYDRWLAGLETPPDGTSVSELPFLSPADVENLRSVSVFTLEALMSLSEEGLSRAGFGTRDLQRRAREYHAAAQDVGVVAAKVNGLQIENDELRRQLEEVIGAHRDLVARLESEQGRYEKRPRGRPPKKDNGDELTHPD